MAARLAQHGYGVVCADVDLAAAEATADSVDGASAVSVDVRSVTETARAVELALDRYGSLAATVACAGILRMGGVASMSCDSFEEVLAVNTTGSFVTATESARAMIGADAGGSIVLIGSMTSVKVSMSGQVAYATSKGGVLMLAKALAVDLAPHGIRVNAVLPGITATPLSESTLADPARRHAALSRVPMGKPATPDDIADAVAFLASPEASYVTGAALPVDGGQLALTTSFPWSS